MTPCQARRHPRPRLGDPTVAIGSVVIEAETELGTKRQKLTNTITSSSAGPIGAKPSLETIVKVEIVGSTGSLAHIRHDASVIIAMAPERHPAGTSGREGYQRPRARKLSAEERMAIRAEAQTGRSLRSLATGYGVSHESVRAVLRASRSAAQVARVGQIMKIRETPRRPGISTPCGHSFSRAGERNSRSAKWCIR